MKRLSILVLVFALMFTFSFGALADNGVLWTDNAGNDPDTEEGWLIDVGTLEGWQESNFETLEYQTAGKSEEVGTGITVDGIKVDWKYPGTGEIGKGGDIDLDQSIDYTVVAFAEIPCVLKMNVFGNGAYAEGISVGDGSKFAIEETGLYMSDGEEGGEVAPGENSHFMIFDPDYGGIVNEAWEFMDVDAAGYATGDAAEAYINACDLWTADIWANVPYGFKVSSTGMGDFAGLDDPLQIQMRYLERTGTGIVSNNSDLPPFNDEVSDNSAWAGNFDLDDEGVEVGTYEAGQNSHINMQFRVPLKDAPAGRYQGEVTFSTYTI